MVFGMIKVRSITAMYKWDDVTLKLGLRRCGSENGSANVSGSGSESGSGG